ncbi:MAG: sulfite exporter TauE/SafE family protein [Pseudomonadota bacterium]
MIEATGLTGAEFAVLLASFLAGGLVKGALGFGLPLVVVSTAPIFVSVDIVLIANATVMPFSNTLQIVQSGRVAASISRFRLLYIALILTLPFGVALGSVISTGMLTVVLGVVVMAFTALQALSPRLQIRPDLERPFGAATGALAGIIGGLTTVNGPIMTLFAVGLGVERRMMVSMQGLAYLITGLILAVGYAGIGLIDGSRLATGLICIAPAFLGMWVGNRLAQRLPQAVFRQVVLAVLFVAGANLALGPGA